ncbi:SET domain-containing protein 5 [Symbiodinium microadriaticum]|uniref:SET domain-containing protein 5 n=1 Tax=Symbiodinium microadriaticum TaxID=2951 RepID=A0A1Q9D5I0_SYMMI|nr:SET domain-containing protein 5 [Symbiodinium microadriaticum]
MLPAPEPDHAIPAGGPLPNACAAYMLMMKRYLDSEAQVFCHRKPLATEVLAAPWFRFGAMLCHGASTFPGFCLGGRPAFRDRAHRASSSRTQSAWQAFRAPGLEKFLVPAVFLGSFTRQRTRIQAKSSGPAAHYINKNLRVTNVGPKGLGVVATAPLARGELLLEEAPLLVFQHQSFEVIFGDLQDVLFDDRTFDLWETSLKETVNSQCGSENTAKFWELADTCSAPGVKTALGIARTNALGLDEDSAGLFLFLSRFNHSCEPNVHHSWQEDRGMKVLRASCSIAANEELCISYLSLLALCAPTRERLGEISDRFGFDCACRACSAGARRMRDSDWRRERLSQLCAALSKEEHRDHGVGRADEIRLHLRKRIPLFFEVDDEGRQELESSLQGQRGLEKESFEGVVESIDMSTGLREAVALLDEELHGHPAARALLFFGAFRRAEAARRLSAAKSLAKAAWNATSTAEGSTSWRAQWLQVESERLEHLEQKLEQRKEENQQGAANDQAKTLEIGCVWPLNAF